MKKTGQELNNIQKAQATNDLCISENALDKRVRQENRSYGLNSMRSPLFV